MTPEQLDQLALEVTCEVLGWQKSDFMDWAAKDYRPVSPEEMLDLFRRYRKALEEQGMVLVHRSYTCTSPCDYQVREGDKK